MKKIRVIIAIGIILQLSFFETDFNLSTVKIDFLLYKSTITGGINDLLFSNPLLHISSIDLSI
jgi:hypothetical protein